MANANIVDHIGSKVTVWTKDGNAAENRQLHTVDEFGVVISNFVGKLTFIPWVQVKYIDYEDSKSLQQCSQQYVGTATSTSQHNQGGASSVI